MKEVAWGEVCSTCLHVESRKGYCSPRLLIFKGAVVPFHMLLVFCFSPLGLPLAYFSLLG